MQAVASLFETYKNAVFQKDLEAFVSIFDEQVRVFDIWEKWSYEGLDAWRGMATGWFASLGTDRDVVTFEDIRIEEVGDMAVASAFVRFAGVSEKGEELRHLYNRLTWVARKKGDAWKIIHEHTSGPIDFASMKVMLHR